MTDPKPGEVAYRALQREARTTRRTTQELLELYALEGVLARLSRSPLRDQFVPKQSPKCENSVAGTGFEPV